MPDDYTTTAPTYLSLGWLPFPLPPGKKIPPPGGVTGRVGTPPSGPDVYEWCELAPRGANIGLRMPEIVIGIDVDQYDDKNGAATLLEHIKRLVPLPPTWRSSARDWPSGIWFYRVPAGLAFPEGLGDGIELIRCIHRYAVVWPSTNPKTGTQYRWYRPLDDDTSGEEEADRPPRVDELPYLPDEWIEDLTGWRTDTEIASAALDANEAGAWLDDHDEPGTCPRVTGRAAHIIDAIRAGTAHDSLSQLVTMARLAEHGHRGVAPVLDDIATEFAHVAVAHGRTPQEAAAEFTRSWRGAVGRVVATTEVHAPVAPCSCGDDPDDIIDRTPPPGVPDQEDPAGLEDAEHTSWWPVDLTGVLDGTITTPPPTVLRRDDGQPLFYPERVNGLIGESESGKTWVALSAVAQELDAGHHVLYIDPEDLAPGFVERCRALGATDDQLRTQLAYINPDESLGSDAAADLRDIVASRAWALIVVDGVNATMSLLGFDIDSSNRDATLFAQKFLKPLAATGAAVCIIDHLPKNNTESKGGVGAQAKRAMMTGCSLRVTVEAEFGRGLKGRLALAVDKDRQGHVRGASQDAKKAGTVVLDSDGVKMAVGITAPDTRPAAERAVDFRPTGVMDRVSRWLASSASDDGWSLRQVIEGVGGKRDVVIVAIDRLVEAGYVAREPGKGNSLRHRHLHRYSEMNELVAADSDEED